MWNILRRLQRQFDLAYAVLVVGIAVLAWANVSLLAERRVLVQRVGTMTTGLTGQIEIKTGDLVPSFAGMTVSGQPEHVSYDGARRYLLFMFDPRCGVCSREAPSWRGLSVQAQALGLTVRWVSLGSAEITRAGLKRDGLSADALIMPDLGTQRAYRVASVPEVVVVSPAGRVEWAHNGAMSEQDKAQLRQEMSGGQRK
jgi:hypothetical protein